ncbi:MAG: zf-HC2 domain-containing protein [Candidatus Wallbacteria bacterium]|nr:zf-HC2 domain-containing protein [Candidatus Wallbacteria bacterium]
MSDSCDNYRRRLPAHLEGVLPPADSLEVKGHIESCDSCRQAAEGWRLEAPRFGDVRMGQEFWAPRERELLGTLRPAPPFWRRWLDALVAPMPVPRVVALALVAALAWFAGAGRPASPPPANPAMGVSPAAAPLPARPVLDVEGISRLEADLG